MLAACGAGPGFDVGVEHAAVIAPGRVEGWAAVLLVQVRLENRGDAPVHVYKDMLQVVGEAGTRGTVREFRDRYRLRQARTPGDEDRRRFEAAFAGVGIGGDDIRELAGAQIEVPPGRTMRVTFPFLLKDGKADDRYAMELTYHDDATDRIRRLNLRVRAR